MALISFLSKICPVNDIKSSSNSPTVSLVDVDTYHRQQNKWYPQRCLLAHFEATLDLPVVNLLAHNNKSQICYCRQISLQSAAVFLAI